MAGMNRILGTAAAVVMAAACASAPAGQNIGIVDKPVPFPAERVELTREYIKQHYGRDVKDITIDPRIIVLHWTAGRTFAGDWNTFKPTRINDGRADVARASALNVGIQFLVDRDGTIYRLQPETWMARHVIGLNMNAIGVENVGGVDDVKDLTPEQVQANIRLVRYLKQKYPKIDYLIGHYEYRTFEGHALWMEKDTAYRTGKVDPGEPFMTAVRNAVADLKLKGPAQINAEKRR